MEEMKKMIDEHDRKVREKMIEEIYNLADDLQKSQIHYLEGNPTRHGKMWSIYMNTYLGHMKVACQRLLKGGAEE